MQDNVIQLAPKEGNRITLSDMERMSIEDVSKLTVDELSALDDDAATLKTKAANYGKWLQAAKEMKFKDSAAAEMDAKDKAFGTIHLDVDGYDVTYEVPKKVKYDQKKLVAGLRKLPAALADTIAKYEVKVSETAYKNLPDDARAHIEPARTVEYGAPKITFKKLED